MKTKINSFDNVARVLSLVAANDGDVIVGGSRIAARSTAAWDPYEVWRTRVLPYQSVLRDAAAKANKPR